MKSGDDYLINIARQNIYPITRMIEYVRNKKKLDEINSAYNYDNNKYLLRPLFHINVDIKELTGLETIKKYEKIISLMKKFKY